MLPPLRVATLGIALALLTGCATTGPPFQAARDVPEDRALVYVYREAGFVGAGVTYMVHANGVEIATLPAGGYFEYRAVPGEVELSARTEAKTSVTIDAEAGKTYYVRGTVGVGVFVGHPHLALVPNDVGAKEIVACKLVPTAEGADAASRGSSGAFKTSVVHIAPAEIGPTTDGEKPEGPAHGASPVDVGSTEVSVSVIDRRRKIVMERTTIGDIEMSHVAFQPSEIELIESVITRRTRAITSGLPESVRKTPVVCEVTEFSVTTPATVLYWDATADIAITLRVANEQRQLTGHGVKRTYAWPSEKILKTATLEALNQVDAAANEALRELLARAPGEAPSP